MRVPRRTRRRLRRAGYFLLPAQSYFLLPTPYADVHDGVFDVLARSKFTTMGEVSTCTCTTHAHAHALHVVHKWGRSAQLSSAQLSSAQLSSVGQVQVSSVGQVR